MELREIRNLPKACSARKVEQPKQASRTFPCPVRCAFLLLRQAGWAESVGDSSTSKPLSCIRELMGALHTARVSFSSDRASLPTRPSTEPTPLGRVLRGPGVSLFSPLSLVTGLLDLSRWLRGEESACQAGDVGSIPGSGGSPGEGNGNSLQHSSLGNPMGRGAWRAVVRGVTKSWIQPSDSIRPERLGSGLLGAYLGPRRGCLSAVGWVLTLPRFCLQLTSPLRLPGVWLSLTVALCRHPGC